MTYRCWRRFITWWSISRCTPGRSCSSPRRCRAPIWAFMPTCDPPPPTDRRPRSAGPARGTTHISPQSAGKNQMRGRRPGMGGARTPRLTFTPPFLTRFDARPLMRGARGRCGRGVYAEGTIRDQAADPGPFEAIGLLQDHRLADRPQGSIHCEQLAQKILPLNRDSLPAFAAVFADQEPVVIRDPAPVRAVKLNRSQPAFDRA